MDVDSLATDLTALEQDQRLWGPANLAGRMSALAFLALATEFVRHPIQATEIWGALSRRVASLKARLTAADSELFASLRAQIKGGQLTPAALREVFNPYTDYLPNQPDALHPRPDSLDALLDGLLALTGEESWLPLDRQMLHYEPTPARTILDFVDHIGLTPTDVFYDIGCGLGRPSILAHLVTGLQTKGLEYDVQLHQQSRRCVEQLGLHDVDLLNGDARSADYSAGTVFFLFTPFRSEMHRTVMECLHARALKGAIKIGTFGPCSFWTAAQPWLRRVGSTADLSDFRVALFESAI